MSSYCLKNGKIREACENDADERKRTAIFHLTAGGEMERLSEIPGLLEGEGVLLYAGEFYIEPLEVQIEFLKASDARRWLEALILRHAERVRHVSEELFVLAMIKEVNT